MPENKTTPNADDFWGEPIHTYTRAQAIADGVLVDVSEMGAEAGFRHPVAMTQGLHAEAVAWDKRNSTHQDETGRLWDVLMMAAYYGRQAPNTDRVTATVLRIPNTRDAIEPEELDFTVHIGPGDTMAPVITLMLTNED